MAQDPNIPKLKISEECLIQVDPLIQLIDLITGAENWLECAKQHPESASTRRSLALKTVGEIRSTGDFEADLLNTIESELQSAGMYEFTGYPLRAVTHLRKAKVKTFEALLNAAVDCECREAKAIEKQLGSAAVQTVLEGKGEKDGRPRRYTEIPAKEVEIENVLASAYIEELKTGAWKKQLSEMSDGTFQVEVYWFPWADGKPREERWVNWFIKCRDDAELFYNQLKSMDQVKRTMQPEKW